MKGFRFPSAFTILFALIALMAALTWVVPVGQYERVHNEELGKDVPVPGSFAPVESNPQGLEEIALAPINGFYDSDSYEAGAIDVALFVLMLGGFLGVVNATGAIDHGIQRIMDVFEGREQWLIPILMALFAAGGTVYGMAEESLAFYAILIPIMLRAGYDTVTAVAVIMLGCAIGTLGSTINPFATVIASDAAGIAFTEGLGLRLFILGGGWLICVIYVMRYAARVRADMSHSLVKDKHEDNKKHFLRNSADRHSQEMTLKEDITLILFALVFAIMIWGVAVAGWWMARMAALFIVAAIVVGLVNRMKEQDLVDNFVDGARDLLGVALIIGLARGIVVIMDAGHLSDTALAWSEGLVADLSPIVFINVVYWIEVAMSFLVPSSSGLAVLSMPIMAPLGDFAGVSRDLVVTAFQSASGLVNMINPTFAVVMGGLAIGRVPYETWLKFMWPLLLVLTVFLMAVLSVGTMI
ncbi:C4-dicarboxylate ABC transporter [Bacterioplanes sanyensis]|uniref:C4-dicarboxylate ABC transporter n=1 Tax=Bacterioplanes sanyensis TaxID=1249553 RepID=A0A222FH35_9GAMM|nr:YfcC family protein [Bacterioplanes sanyensis]ASP37553.1 C4-dicarboxylate ABC transporter [Bacterioplanes sanyensis]